MARRPLRTVGLALGLVVSCATTAFFATTRGTSDVDIWLAWADTTELEGPVRGFAKIGADYPPGASLFLHTTAAAAERIGISRHGALKLCLTGALLVTAITVLAATRSVPIALVAYLALILNAEALMYLDILMAPFLVLGCAAARRGQWASLLLWLACASMFKYQPILIAPFAVVFAWHRQKTARMPPSDWAPRLAAAALLWGGLLTVYGGREIADSFIRASRHHTLSSFAANPLWVLTWGLQAAQGGAADVVDIVSASRPMLRILTLVSGGLYLMALARYWKRGDDSSASFFRFSLLGFLVYFLSSAGVHENHLFVAVILAGALVAESAEWAALAATVAGVANLNLVAFYGWSGYIDRRVFIVDLTVWVAVVGSAVLIAVSRRLSRVGPAST